MQQAAVLVPPSGPDLATLLAPVSARYLSPTAIETFEACPRKWAWNKLDRIRYPEDPAQETGIDFHRQKENWLKHAIPFDMTTKAGEMAMASVHLDPHPFTATIEQEIWFDYEGIRLGGKIDAHWLMQGTPASPARAVVLDHKSTGNLQWAKLTKEDLLAYPQPPIYGTWAAHAYGTELVEFRWNYVTKDKRPKPKPSWHLVHRDEILGAMPPVVATARRMLQVVDQANAARAQGYPFGAKDLPYNPDACGQYGGCKYLSNCNLTPLEKWRGFRMTMDWASSLRGAQAPLTAAAPPVEAPPAWTPPQNGAAAPVGFTPPNGAAPALPFTPPTQVQTTVMPPALTQALAQPPQGFGQAVNPPEQTLPPAPPAPPEVTTPPEAAKKRGRKPKAEASAPEESAAVVAVGLGFAEELAIAATKGLFSNPSFNPAQVDAAAAAVKRYVGALIA